MKNMKKQLKVIGVHLGNIYYVTLLTLKGQELI